MAQQDHSSQRHSNSSSGGAAGGGGGNSGGGGGNGVYDHHHRCSKKLKQKKVPQRGLGVAQLEKIRLEEQQKKDVSSCSNSIISPSNSSNCLAFMPTMSAPLIPMPPPCPTNLHLIQNMDVLNQSKAGGSEAGWLMGGRSGSWPRLWSDEHNHNNNHVEGENHGGLDHHRGGFTFMKNVRLPYESNSLTPSWSLPNVMQQRSQPCSSSMMNVSTGTSLSSSAASVLNLQMEPPSNQSYCGNNNFTPPLWPEEDKMVGMKRPYPFSLEDVPIPTFHCKLPSSYVSKISRSDESASCSNGGTTSIEPSNPVIREGPLNSSAISEPNPKKVVHENGGGLNGDFLTLAPPEAHSSPRQKLLLSTKLSLQCQSPQCDETLPPQGTKDNPIHVPGQGGSLKQQTFITFLPPAKTHNGQPIGRRNSNSNGETGECVDLNLKL